MDQDCTPNRDKIIQLNEAAVRNHLGQIVRSTVEQTLNDMLDAEADRLCNAEKYQRNDARRDTRAGHYERKLQTQAGEVTLKVPKLRRQTFETAIIERYRRREASVEEALIEMYLAGVSVRRVEDITEALWGTKVSPGTISNLNKKVYAKIDAWRNQPIVDGVSLCLPSGARPESRRFYCSGLPLELICLPHQLRCQEKAGEIKSEALACAKDTPRHSHPATARPEATPPPGHPGRRWRRSPRPVAPAR